MPEFNTDNHKIDWSGYVISREKKYTLLKKIGYGSYSSVWMAKTDDLELKYCAIKIHNIEDFNEGVKEIKVYKKLNKLKTPNIISIIDDFIIERNICDEQVAHICIVMDLFGYSTYNLIAKKGYTDGLPVDTVINIIKQVLETLKIVHENNIIHGDLKPENIILCDVELDDLLESTINDESSDSDSDVSKTTFSDTTSEMNSEYSDISEKDTTSDEDCFEKEIMDDNKSLQSVSIYSEDGSEYDSEEDVVINSCNTNNEIHKYLIKNSNIKLIDIGTCCLEGEKQRKVIHTTYYRAPEVILRLGYDTKADMWALGCTMYELLTGKILFDPDEKDVQKKRYQLELLIKKIGSIPNDMINQSSQKEIYFTNKCYLKGMKHIQMDNTWNDFLSTVSFDKKNIVLDFVLQLLSPDPQHRLTVVQALEHEIFTII